MAMVISYELDGALYINLTNRCRNDCAFCLRNNHDTVNGEDNLWLDREPTEDEIKTDLSARDLSKFSWIVFCGYGEPLMRFDTCINIAKWLKENFPHIKLRINTNGQANLIEGYDVTPKFDGIIDSISISLNSPTKEQYQDLCKSVFGEAAFDGLLDFAKRATKFVPSVTLSVVETTLTKEEIEVCRTLSEKCNCNFRVRAFID